MAEPQLQVLAFDLDGTLADTAPDLAAALNHTLAEIGRAPIESEAVRLMVGHGVRALLRRALAETGEQSEALVDKAYPIFIDHYRRNICVGTRAYDGVERALDALAERNVSLAICTNKPEGLSRSLVDALGWDGRFAAIVGGDTLTVRKPDPAPLVAAVDRAGGGRAVFVGDSITDVDTARAAALPVIAVSFGFSDRPAAALGADLVIDHFDDLLLALHQLSTRL